jgi:hypothetical protein
MFFDTPLYFNKEQIITFYVHQFHCDGNYQFYNGYIAKLLYFKCQLNALNMNNIAY